MPPLAPLFARWCCTPSTWGCWSSRSPRSSSLCSRWPTTGQGPRTTTTTARPRPRGHLRCRQGAARLLHAGLPRHVPLTTARLDPQDPALRPHPACLPPGLRGGHGGRSGRLQGGQREAAAAHRGGGPGGRVVCHAGLKGSVLAM